MGIVSLNRHLELGCYFVTWAPDTRDSCISSNDRRNDFLAVHRELMAAGPPGNPEYNFEWGPGRFLEPN